MLLLSLFVFSYSPYYQNDIGCSSLGMGGTPIGLNSSVECGLYNPAAFVSAEKLNVFTGYQLTRGEMYSVILPDDTSRTDYAFLDYLGFALPFGKDYFFSLSLSVPYRSVINFPMTWTVIDPSVPEGYRAIPGEWIFSERFYSLNTTVGRLFKDRFSVGMNLGLFLKRSSMAEVAEDPAVNNTNTVDKYGFEPCLGLQYKASELIRFGFLIKKGFGEAYRFSSTGLDTTFSIESDEGLPLVLGLGAGVNLKDKIYFNLSAEYIRWTLSYSDYFISYGLRNVMRLHLGGQYRFNDLLSLSAGFYTEPSPTIIGAYYLDPNRHNQMFLTGGIGLDFGRIALNISAASSALIKNEPALREESHFNFSLSYR